jgi:hypothetical protein
MSLKINIALKILLFILSLNEILNQSNEVVFLKFKSLYEGTDTIEDCFVNNLLQIKLYTRINIGQNNQEITLLPTRSHPYFSLTPLHLKNKDGIYNTNYNFRESPSFKNISYPHEYIIESKEDIKAKETFKFTFFNYKDNNYKEKTINDLDIILGINEQYKEKPYFVNFGIELIMNKINNTKQDYNLFYQLKSRRVIDDYYISYIFDNEKKIDDEHLFTLDDLINLTGKIVIGDLPKYFANTDFNKYQLLSTYSYRYESPIFQWTIKFNEITYKYGDRTYTDNSKIVNFNINDFLIIAPLSYTYNIKSVYFNSYVNQKVCHLFTDNGYETYYFDKSQYFNLTNLKNFPSLFFKNNELQYTFELNYKDLFIERDGKYWFLIAFPTINRSSQWFFGRLFLKKYNFIFNYDSKTISFYNPNLPKDDPSDKKGDSTGNKTNIIIIICIAAIVVLSLISISLGIYLSKMCYKANKNKGRLNEMKENFIYESQENNINENESQSITINA